MDVRIAQALYLRGKYVHSHKGKYKRRHRRASVARVVPQIFVGEIHFATTVVTPE
jgi:glutaredoxin